MSTEPQSIVHQVVRLERKVTQSIASSVRRMRKRHAQSSFVPPADIEACIENTSRHTDQLSQASSTSGSTTTPSGVSSSYSSASDDDSFQSLESTWFGGSDDLYKTITQNELMSICLIGDSSVSVVHFFDESSLMCDEIDNQLEQASQKRMDCKFHRINGSLAPFIASKLRIQSFPAVIVFSNGSVIDRMSKFESVDSLISLKEMLMRI